MRTPLYALGLALALLAVGHAAPAASTPEHEVEETQGHTWCTPTPCTFH